MNYTNSIINHENSLTLLGKITKRIGLMREVYSIVVQEFYNHLTASPTFDLDSLFGTHLVEYKSELFTRGIEIMYTVCAQHLVWMFPDTDPEAQYNILLWFMQAITVHLD